MRAPRAFACSSSSSTINLENPDPECDLDYIPHTSRQIKINAVVNNSFGFGGHNASLIARKFVG